MLDYESVREGLQSGQIGHLGLDVQWVEPMDPEDWIAQHPRCFHLLFPHILWFDSKTQRVLNLLVCGRAQKPMPQVSMWLAVYDGNPASTAVQAHLSCSMLSSRLAALQGCRQGMCRAGWCSRLMWRASRSSATGGWRRSWLQRPAACATACRPASF